MQARVAKSNPAPLNVIEVIAAGLSMTIAHLSFLIVPLLVDLWFWVGWRVTPTALIEWLQGELLKDESSRSVEAAEQLGNYANSDLTQLVAAFVPSLLSSMDASDYYQLRDRPVYSPETAAGVIGVVAIMFVLMAALYAVFAVPLADAVVGRSRTLHAKAGAMAVVWYRFLGFLLLAVAGILLLSLVALTIWGIAAVTTGIDLAGLLIPVAFVAALAAGLLLLFTPEAIVIRELGVINAMRSSATFVRRNFWPTVALFAASLLVTFGFGQIWEQMAERLPGLILGCAANAFFAVGLTVASMMFFAQRSGNLESRTPPPEPIGAT